MKLVADDKIPYIAELFTAVDNIAYVPGENIARQHLQNATILLTRTVTPINAELLNGTSIQFVGTATTGIDHVDTTWLFKNNIAFAHAAGSNTKAVAEYVLSCVFAVQTQGYLTQKNPIAGIIGYGRIGRMVADLLQKLGFFVICYDPVRSDTAPFSQVSLKQLVAESDFITLHTPLTYSGPYPTIHMLGKTHIQLMKKNVVLLNSARGKIIDQTALLQAKNSALCIDVWENEPHISLDLLNNVLIGTPHIAGYSQSAKYIATQMIYEQAAHVFGWEMIRETTTIHNAQMSLEGINPLSHYNPLIHTEKFRHACLNASNIAHAFTEARNNYVLREELLWNGS